MRASPRGDKLAPASLSRKDKKGLSELERAQAHFSGGSARKAFGFAAYKAQDVKQRLEALFHGKCAYCESRFASTAPVDVEHYRPKGAIDGNPSHPGYWWIAMAWDNLLPSCIDCNRKRKQATPPLSGSLVVLDAASRQFSTSSIVLSGKKDSFPVRGAHLLPQGANFADEQPLLLDPCRDDPSEHLVFHVERPNLISLVLPREAIDPAIDNEPLGSAVPSMRGAVSIQIYGLNRLGLVQDRTRILRHLDFLETIIVELGEIMESLAAVAQANPTVMAAVKRLETLQDRIVEEIRAMAAADAPYSAMVSAWIDAFTRRLAE